MPQDRSNNSRQACQLYSQRLLVIVTASAHLVIDSGGLKCFHQKFFINIDHAFYISSFPLILSTNHPLVFHDLFLYLTVTMPPLSFSICRLNTMPLHLSALVLFPEIFTHSCCRPLDFLSFVHILFKCCHAQNRTEASSWGSPRRSSA